MRSLVLVLTLATWASVSAGQRPREHTRLFPVVVNGLTGFIDSSGRMIIAPRFDDTFPFTEGRAAVRLGNAWGYIDTTGTMIIEPHFDYASTFSEHLAWVEIGGHRGYIDLTGRVVIAPRFDVASEFSEGRAFVTMGRTLGYIDHTGKLVFRQEMPRAVGETLDFSDGLAVVYVRGKWGYVDTTGAMAIEPRFHPDNPREFFGRGLRFSEGRAAVPIGPKWGYIDRTGRVVIEARFDEAESFDEGLAPVRVGNRYGYIDTTGTMVFAPQFVVAWGFSEGLAAVRDSSKRSGYIDHTGKVVIPPQWREVQPFSGGLACVRSDGECEYIDRTGRYVWRASSVAVAAGIPEPPDTTPLGGTGSLVDRVAEIVDRAEALEAGRPVDRAQGEIMREVAKATTQLSAYLSQEPNDIRALILSVRLGRFRQVAQPLVVQRGDKMPTFTSLAAEYAPYHAALNRALQLEPKNAEAHYWQARLYGLSHDWMGMLDGLTPPPAAELTLARAYADSAVRFGRRAVELAPDRVPYREALAIYLILSEQEREAAAVLRDVAGGHHPMATLLADWEAIPVPAGAVALSAEARGMARMWMEEGTIPDYPFLRVRMYVVMMPADSVQAFYRKRWPGFQLIAAEDERSGTTRVRSFVQHLRWRSEGFVPARNKKDIPDEPIEGVNVALIEITNPPPEVREKFPVPVGKVFCSLSFINVRRFDAR